MPLPLSLTDASTGQPSLSWKAGRSRQLTGQCLGLGTCLPSPLPWVHIPPGLGPGEVPSHHAWHPL